MHRYIGNGETIPTVPARDLTPEEWAIYGPEIEAVHANTGRTLYEPVSPETAQDAQDAPGQAKEEGGV